MRLPVLVYREFARASDPAQQPSLWSGFFKLARAANPTQLPNSESGFSFREGPPETNAYTRGNSLASQTQTQLASRIAHLPSAYCLPQSPKAFSQTRFFYNLDYFIELADKTPKYVVVGIIVGSYKNLFSCF
jgi:hypothetical protein